MSQVDGFSLFKRISSGQFDACLMTTFSIDFPFYENVLLRRMTAAGVRHHVVLADEGMLVNAMDDQPPHSAGQDYVLAPMRCQGAFHPKLFLLVGEKCGLLAVGSHNLTLSGFGRNLEITNFVTFQKNSNEQNLFLFQQSFRAFGQWIEDYGSSLPQGVTEAWERTRRLAPWLSRDDAEPSKRAKLITSSKSSSSLWEQMAGDLPNEIEHVTGISAFFDRRSAFVEQLIKISKGQVTLGIQPETVSAHSNLISMEGAHVVDTQYLIIGQAAKYSHAKLLYFEGNESLFVSGSANLSWPAWLEEADRKNAEAVLLLKGEQADNTATSLGLDSLKDSPRVKHIEKHEEEVVESTTASTTISVFELNNDHELSVPVNENWPTGHYLAYRDDFGGFLQLGKRTGSCWLITGSELRMGKPILVVADAVICARLLVLNAQRIASNTSTGRERDLQHALGSLTSDAPDLDRLFSVVLKIYSETDSGSVLSAQGQKKTKEEEASEARSLIDNAPFSNKEEQKAGKRRVSGGQLAILLDVLIYTLNRSNSSDSSVFYGEDSRGRNEEEIIGTEDPGEEPEVHENFQDSDQAKREKAEFCQGKLEAVFRKLENNFKSGQQSDARWFGTAVSFSLGAICIVQQLCQVQPNEKKYLWVTRDFLNRLVGLCFQHLLEDDLPIEKKRENTSLFPVFESNEWSSFIAYLCWLCWKAGINLSFNPPVSMEQEERDKLIWRGACWLYLAQHITDDKEAREMASDLMAHHGTAAENWLKFLVESGKSLRHESKLPNFMGFDLARPAADPAQGFRLVRAYEGDMANLATIRGAGDRRRFKTSFLEFVGC